MPKKVQWGRAVAHQCGIIHLLSRLAQENGPEARYAAVLYANISDIGDGLVSKTKHQTLRQILDMIHDAGQIGLLTKIREAADGCEISSILAEWK